VLFSEHLKTAATDFGLSLSDEQVRMFSHYQEILVEWNQKINLTAITDPQEIAVKHFIDSLSCLDAEVFPIGCSVIDVGTGAGFPGLPLKIYRPDIQLCLVDSLQKRIKFLQTVIKDLEIKNVEIHHLRAEEAGRLKGCRARFDVAVSRAVARLGVLCELCLPLVRVGGYFVAMKGAKFREEISEAEIAVKIMGGRIRQVKEVSLPGLDDVRAVIFIEKEKSTPEKYPRRPGIPEKNPL
jgi:16S rRNA (guanine527-N7)-methyltransferase